MKDERVGGGVFEILCSLFIAYLQEKISCIVKLSLPPSLSHSMNMKTNCSYYNSMHRAFCCVLLTV